METKANSLIALLGIDESLTYIRTGNDLDRASIIADLLKYGHTDYLIEHEKVKIIEDSFLYLQNFDSLHACNAEELELLNTNDAPDIDIRYQENDVEVKPNYGTIPENTVDDADDDDDESSVRRDFREVFIFETVTANKNGKASYEVKLPDTITTWLVSGFAMHKVDGFALAEPAHITSIQQLFIKLHLPYSIKFGEVLKIDVTIFSFIKRKPPLRVDVTIISPDDDFELIDFNGCKLNVIEDDETPKSVSVLQNSASNTFFHIRALKSGEIKILVKAKSSKGNDAVEKVLIVEHEGTTHYEPKPISLEFDSENQIETKTIEFKNQTGIVDDSINFHASVSGSVIKVPPDQRTSAGHKNFEKVM